MTGRHIATVRDVRSWPALLGLTALAAALLGYHLLFGGIPPVIVATSGAFVSVAAWYGLFGAREIVVTEEEICVWRRGRERMRQRVSYLVDIKAPLPGVQILIFRDGRRLWWSPLYQAGAVASDHLARVVQEYRSSGRTEGASDSNVLLQDICFDPAICVGCEAPATHLRPILARRGYDALIGHHFVVRKVLIPVCQRCRTKRRIAGALVFAIPLAPLALSIVVGIYLNAGDINEVVIAACAIAILIPALLVANFGYRLADYATLGLSLGSLDATHARVPLRLRRPEILRRPAAQLGIAPDGPSPRR